MDVKDFVNVDKSILNKVRKNFSISKNDMKEIIMIPEAQGVMGVRSFHGTILAAKAQRQSRSLCLSASTMAGVWTPGPNEA